MVFLLDLLTKREKSSKKEPKKLPELTYAEFLAVISDVKAELISETCKGSRTTGIDYAYTDENCPGGILISKILGKEIKFCAKCHMVIGYVIKPKPPP